MMMVIILDDGHVDDGHDINIVMSMCNLIEYSDKSSKTSDILWQYCRDEPAVNATHGNIIDCNAYNTTTGLFKIKEKLTGQTGNNGTKNVEVIVSLKYLSNFWITLEMPLINCEINIDLNWSKNCVIVDNNADQATTFSITDAKLVPVVTL